jgi:hypothetical protein
MIEEILTQKKRIIPGIVVRLINYAAKKKKEQ